MPRLLGPAAALAFVLVAAGCGTGGLSEGGDVSAGKALFIAKCGSCHTMADAGSKGTIGPNLDNAFGPARQQGYDDSTVQQVVRDQIELASPPMPKNLVRGADADSVAAYVAKCAGWNEPGPCATASAPPPPPPAPPPPPSTSTGATTTGTTTTGTTTTTEGGGDAVKGKALYTSLGCQGCHSLDGGAGAGPTFKGLAGRETKLSDGTTLTADDAYLLQSILDPDTQIVAGFSAGVMSSVIKPGQVSREDAADLIAFIKTVK